MSAIAEGVFRDPTAQECEAHGAVWAIDLPRLTLLVDPGIDQAVKLVDPSTGRLRAVARAADSSWPPEIRPPLAQALRRLLAAVPAQDQPGLQEAMDDAVWLVEGRRRWSTHAPIRVPRVDGPVVFDNAVVADLVGEAGSFVSIYGWSSLYPGRGGTRRPLQRLREYGRQVLVHDPGPCSSASRQYWAHMLHEGLVDQALDEEGRDITAELAKEVPVANHAAFCRWFEGSLVTDSGGGPLEVYHGTAAGELIERFEGEAYAGWFAELAAKAEDYLDVRGLDEGSAVYPVFLSIKRPLDLGRHLDSDDEFDADVMARAMGVPAEEVQALFDGCTKSPAYWGIIHTREFEEWVGALGYDGIRARESGQITWAALEDRQIKPAVLWRPWLRAAAPAPRPMARERP